MINSSLKENGFKRILTKEMGAVNGKNTSLLSSDVCENKSDPCAWQLECERG